MKKDFNFWIGITANFIWIGLGLVCFLAAAGVVSELATWWLFGIGLVAGGLMGLIGMLRTAKEDLI